MKNTIRRFLRKMGQVPLAQSQRFRTTRRRKNYKLHFEALEQRTLPALIGGVVFNDIDADGVRGAEENGLADRVVFRDLNANSTFDSRTERFAAAAEDLALVPGPFGAEDFVSPIAVSGLTSISDIEVEVNVENKNAAEEDPVLVGLLTPSGALVGTGATMFFLNAGDSFDVIIDDDATESILLPSGEQRHGQVSGTFQGVQPFSGVNAHVFDGSPNGTYNLIFFGNPNGVTLNSWALQFTIPEPNTTTAPDGSYVFDDLDAGNHRVGVVLSPGEVQTLPTDGDGLHNVNLTQDQIAVRDFGIKTVPDLRGSRFGIAGATRQAGDEIDITFTITNGEAGSVGGFSADIVLATDGVIDGNDIVLDSIEFESLEPFGSVAGTATLTLPDVDGLTNAGTVIGIVIDPGNPGQIVETNELNNSNVRAGLDFEFLQPLVNKSLTGAGIQQFPSIAVNPNDPDHVAIAYMDYALQNNGYAGIGITVSFDGGENFQTTHIPIPLGFNDGIPFDTWGAAWPSAEFDANGKLYVTFMAATFWPSPIPLDLRSGGGPEIVPGQIPGLTYPFDPLGGNAAADERALGLISKNSIVVAASDNGGLDFDSDDVSLVTVNNAFEVFNFVNYDAAPDIAIDTDETLPDGSDNPHFGNIYIAFARHYPPGQFPGQLGNGGGEIYLAVSQDGGATYQLKLDNDGNTVLRDPTLLSASLPPGVSFSLDPKIETGRGFLIASQFAGAGFPVYISTDGGNSFSLPDRSVQNLQLPFGQARNIRPPRSLQNASFRTFPVRQILVDPVRPGVMYALEAVRVTNQFTGELTDDAEISFAFSLDNGVTWRRVFTVGGHATNVDEIPAAFLSELKSTLNDDNFNRFLRFAENLQNEVTTGQALPALAIDENGNLAAIWYDTRRDPANHNLDVFATVSADGGRSFTSNFRLTTESFDPDLGAFTDAAGNTTFYLGDRIGVASSVGTVYAVWTDTRNADADLGINSQDIFFARVNARTPPAAPQDRFEGNDSLATATQFGPVSIETQPRLVVDALDEDWFAMQASATGTFVVTISAEQGGEFLDLEVFDENGGLILDPSDNPVASADMFDDAGILIGRKVELGAGVGDKFFFKVTADSAAALTYTLSALSLTEDLGEAVRASTTGDLNPGDRALYRVVAGVTGLLEVTVDGQGISTSEIVDVTVLSADGVTVLGQGLFAPGAPFASGAETVTISVDEGQTLFVAISGEPRVLEDIDIPELGIEDLNLPVAVATTGSFSLELTNRDQFSLPDDAAISHSLLFGQIEGDKSAWEVTFLPRATGKVKAVFTDPFGLPFADEQLEILGPDGSVLAGPFEDGEEFEFDVQEGLEVSFRIARTSPPVGSDRLFMLEFVNQFDLSVFGKASLFFPGHGILSDVAVGDLNQDGLPDVVASSSSVADVINVYIANRDGTFKTPATYPVGAGLNAQDKRELTIFDIDGDGDQDVVVTNPLSSDSSILLNRANGELQPQRRFDGTFHNASITTGNFNSDNLIDMVIGQDLLGTGSFSVIINNGGGATAPQVITPINFPDGIVGVNAADLNGDGNDDLIVFGRNNGLAEIFTGDGAGQFVSDGTLPVGTVTVAAELADVNADGFVDIITADLNLPAVFIRLGDGKGNFSDLQQFFVGVDDDIKRGIFSLTVGDFSSQIEQPDGSTLSGGPDGVLDLIVHAGPRSGEFGKSQVIVAPGLIDKQANFAGFGDPQLVAQGELARQIAILETGNGVDIIAADRTGIRRISNLQENDTLATARSLGVITHNIQIKQSIVPGKPEAFFKFVVPTEAVAEAGNQVIDISAGFDLLEGPGLQMQIVDENGNVLFEGARLRFEAAQGQEVTVRIFGIEQAGEVGAGAFTLIINVLPQIVKVETQAPVPGSLPTSLVVTFQGDQLDTSAATDPNNWVLVSLGPDGQSFTSDDSIVPVSSSLNPIVHNPGANVNPSAGLTFPANVRQTVTLTFDQPLPEGAYVIQASPAIQSRDLFDQEGNLLTNASGFNGHPVVSQSSGAIVEGGAARFTSTLLPGDFQDFVDGTASLTQLQNDLGALLDQLLRELGDDTVAVPAAITEQLFARMAPSAQQTDVPLLVIWLDPVSIGLTDPQAQQAVYDLGSNQVSNNIPQAFVEVGGNVELVVIPATEGTYTLNISDVPPTARGGALIFGNGPAQPPISLTAAMRAEVTNFSFLIPGPGQDVAPTIPVIAGDAGLTFVLSTLSGISLAGLADSAAGEAGSAASVQSSTNTDGLPSQQSSGAGSTIGNTLLISFGGRVSDLLSADGNSEILKMFLDEILQTIDWLIELISARERKQDMASSDVGAAPLQDWLVDLVYAFHQIESALHFRLEAFPAWIGKGIEVTAVDHAQNQHLAGKENRFVVTGLPNLEADGELSAAVPIKEQNQDECNRQRFVFVVQPWPLIIVFVGAMYQPWYQRYGSKVLSPVEICLGTTKGLSD